MTTFNPEMIQQIAASIFAKEQEEIRRQQEMISAHERAEAAALKEAERQERIKAEAERIEARLRAERALAEERARIEKAQMDAAIAAELVRLRNRTPIEILQDEVASLKKNIEEMKSIPQVKMTAVVKAFPTERKFRVSFPRPSEEGGMSCNFKDKNGNIIFHFNPRPSRLVLNSHKKNHGWGSEQTCNWVGFLGNPWERELFIKVTEEGFMLTAQQQDFNLFPHRFPVNLDEIAFDHDQRMVCIEL